MRVESRDIAAARQALLEVPFSGEGWEGALRRIAAATHSSRVQLVAFGGPAVMPFNCINDTDPSFGDGFAEIEGGSPEVNWRIACAGKPLEIAHEPDYREARRRVRRGLYDDFVSEWDMPHGCQAVLTRRPGLLIGLATLRTAAEGWIAPDDCEAFAALVPAVLHAVRTRLAIEDNGERLLRHSLEAVRSPALVFDASGRVTGMTPAADALLAGGRALRLAAGWLTARHPASDRALQRAIADVVAGRTLSAQLWLANGALDEGGLRARLFPLPRHEGDFGLAPRAVMLLHQPEHLADECGEALSAMFDLTPAEAAVAVAAANGLSRTAIAAARGVSSDTVNDQFKSIFRKLGINRQPELVALVNQLLR
jgi:DNA-binding CsgD family transcriptional regulator